MKRFVFGLVLLLSVFLLAGCKKQIVCSKSEKNGDKETSVEIIAELDGADKITAAHISYDFGDEKTASQYCDLFKQSLGEKEKDKIECKGSKITMSNVDDLDGDTGSDKMVGKTKSDLLKEAKEAGYTCK